MLLAGAEGAVAGAGLDHSLFKKLPPADDAVAGVAVWLVPDWSGVAVPASGPEAGVVVMPGVVTSCIGAMDVLATGVLGAEKNCVRLLDRKDPTELASPPTLSVIERARCHQRKATKRPFVVRGESLH